MFGCRENAGKGKDVGILVVEFFFLPHFLDLGKRELHLNEHSAAMLVPFCWFFPYFSSSSSLVINVYEVLII